MECAICGKTNQETTLFKGILATEMVKVCEDCAEDQKIPIIRKPSVSQLSQADKTYSVRERLTRMQSAGKRTQISDDQMTTQKNLARLKAPPKKQYHPDVLENYYWTLKMARRRSKMTTSQLARKIDSSPQIVLDIEKGILPKDFKEIFSKLESLFGIKLLAIHEPEISFTRKNQDKEREILEAVARKMKNPEADLEEDEDMEDVHERIESEADHIKGGTQPRNLGAWAKKIEKEEIKLSKKTDIQNITLNDLIDRKRAREKYKQKLKTDEMMGEDIEIEEL